MLSLVTSDRQVGHRHGRLVHKSKKGQVVEDLVDFVTQVLMRNAERKKIKFY